MRGVAASSTVLKYLQKVKLTNTLQHIQVYKSQEIKCQKIPESCEKHIYIFLMTLWSFTLFCISVSVSIYSCVNFIHSRSSHLGYSSLGFQIKLCTIFHEWRHTILLRIHTQIFNKDKHKQAGLPDQINALFPLTHTIIYAFAFKEPSHVQNFYSKRSL